MSPPPAPRPTTADLQRLCHRVRAAGAPGARARPALVDEYRSLAARLGVPAAELATGRDLAAAAAELLRGASAATRGGLRPAVRGDTRVA